MGDSIRDFELEAIASWPTHKNMYKVPIFRDLPTIVSSVRDAVCNGKSVLFIYLFIYSLTY